MSDNNENVDQDKTPEGPLQTDHGTTTIEENVVAKIAGMAARQVPGVYGMGNAVRRAFSAVTDRIPTTQTNVTGGITVHKGETQTAIDVIVVVEYGYSIINVCNDIRSNIIDQIEAPPAWRSLRSTSTSPTSTCPRRKQPTPPQPI